MLNRNVIKGGGAEVAFFDYDESEFQYEPPHQHIVEEQELIELAVDIPVDSDEFIPNDVGDLEQLGTEQPEQDRVVTTSGRIVTAREMELKAAELEAESILMEARIQADVLLQEAEERAARTSAVAFEKGYQDGYHQGVAEAKAENYQWLRDESNQLLESIKSDIETIEKRKEEILDEYLDDMRDLSITIAEKVINISLKTSGEIVKKMIVAATEKSKNVTWAKLYISQTDWELSLKTHVSIIDSLKRITKTVNIEIMENRQPGTCIIELPDQIIDASVTTQIGQVRKLLSRSE